MIQLLQQQNLFTIDEIPITYQSSLKPEIQKDDSPNKIEQFQFSKNFSRQRSTSYICDELDQENSARLFSQRRIEIQKQNTVEQLKSFQQLINLKKITRNLKRAIHKTCIIKNPGTSVHTFKKRNTEDIEQLIKMQTQEKQSIARQAINQKQNQTTKVEQKQTIDQEIMKDTQQITTSPIQKLSTRQLKAFLNLPPEDEAEKCTNQKIIQETQSSEQNQQIQQIPNNQDHKITTHVLQKLDNQYGVIQKQPYHLQKKRSTSYICDELDQENSARLFSQRRIEIQKQITVEQLKSFQQLINLKKITRNLKRAIHKTCIIKNPGTSVHTFKKRNTEDIEQLIKMQTQEKQSIARQAINQKQNQTTKVEQKQTIDQEIMKDTQQITTSPIQKLSTRQLKAFLNLPPEDEAEKCTNQKIIQETQSSEQNQQIQQIPNNQDHKITTHVLQKLDNQYGVIQKQPYHLQKKRSTSYICDELDQENSARLFSQRRIEIQKQITVEQLKSFQQLINLKKITRNLKRAIHKTCIIKNPGTSVHTFKKRNTEDIEQLIKMQTQEKQSIARQAINQKQNQTTKVEQKQTIDQEIMKDTQQITTSPIQKLSTRQLKAFLNLPPEDEAEKCTNQKIIQETQSSEQNQQIQQIPNNQDHKITTHVLQKLDNQYGVIQKQPYHLQKKRSTSYICDELDQENSARLFSQRRIEIQKQITVEQLKSFQQLINLKKITRNLKRAIHKTCIIKNPGTSVHTFKKRNTEDIEQLIKMQTQEKQSIARQAINQKQNQTTKVEQKQTIDQEIMKDTQQITTSPIQKLSTRQLKAFLNLPPEDEAEKCTNQKIIQETQSSEQNQQIQQIPNNQDHKITTHVLQKLDNQYGVIQKQPYHLQKKRSTSYICDELDQENSARLFSQRRIEIQKQNTVEQLKSFQQLINLKKITRNLKRAIHKTCIIKNPGTSVHTFKKRNTEDIEQLIKMQTQEKQSIARQAINQKQNQTTKVEQKQTIDQEIMKDTQQITTSPIQKLSTRQLKAFLNLPPEDEAEKCTNQKIIQETQSSEQNQQIQQIPNNQDHKITTHVLQKLDNQYGVIQKQEDEVPINQKKIIQMQQVNTNQMQKQSSYNLKHKSEIPIYKNMSLAQLDAQIEYCKEIAMSSIKFSKKINQKDNFFQKQKSLKEMQSINKRNGNEIQVYGSSSDSAKFQHKQFNFINQENEEKKSLMIQKQAQRLQKIQLQQQQPQKQIIKIETKINYCPFDIKQVEVAQQILTPYESKQRIATDQFQQRKAHQLIESLNREKFERQLQYQDKLSRKQENKLQGQNLKNSKTMEQILYKNNLTHSRLMTQMSEIIKTK